MGLTIQHPGLAYGAGTASEGLLSGEFVKLAGADLFAKVSDATDKVFGVAYRDALTGDYVTIYTAGGVYETDTFGAGILAGDDLEVNPVTATLQKATTGKVVAMALAVTGPELKFKLVI